MDQYASAHGWTLAGIVRAQGDCGFDSIVVLQDPENRANLPEETLASLSRVVRNWVGDFLAQNEHTPIPGIAYTFGTYPRDLRESYAAFVTRMRQPGRGHEMELPVLAAVSILMQRPIFAVSSSTAEQAQTMWFYPDDSLSQEAPLLLGLRATTPGAHWMPYVRAPAAAEAPLPEASATHLDSSRSTTVSPACPPLAFPPAASAPTQSGSHVPAGVHFQTTHDGVSHVCCAPNSCSQAKCSRCQKQVGLCCLHAQADTVFNVVTLSPSAYAQCLQCRVGRASTSAAVLLSGSDFDAWDDQYHLSGRDPTV